MVRRLLFILSSVLSLGLVARLASPPRKTAGNVHLSPLLPRTDILRAAGRPLLNLVTDYFWIQTIQAIGIAKTPAESRDVYDYAKLVTELDPDFRPVYAFAGVIIPARLPSGAWANTKESTELLGRGVAQFPANVYLRILLTYNLVHFERDYSRAARLAEETSKLSDAPSYLSGLATRLYARAGAYEAGMILARSLAESSEDPEARTAFGRRVMEIELERELTAVDEALALYKAREGHLPRDISTLVSSGDLRAMPHDPLGGQIRINAAGHATSTSLTHRLTGFAGGSMEESP